MYGVVNFNIPIYFETFLSSRQIEIAYIKCMLQGRYWHDAVWCPIWFGCISEHQQGVRGSLVCVIFRSGSLYRKTMRGLSLPVYSGQNRTIPSISNKSALFNHVHLFQLPTNLSAFHFITVSFDSGSQFTCFMECSTRLHLAGQWDAPPVLHNALGNRNFLGLFGQSDRLYTALPLGAQASENCCTFVAQWEIRTKRNIGCVDAVLTLWGQAVYS